MTWTPAREWNLRKLWADGLSAIEVARELGGVTRNAVIGKVHRLGLETRFKAPTGGRPKKRKPARPPTVRVVKVGPIETEPRPCSLHQLTKDTCRWPEGEPVAWFCGAQPVEGRPYCMAHCRMAYRPAA